ncbi:hypothetical protein BEL04_13765 [Mucilaginibacter sp. PPCGB 2223]|uniref:hypothetical protein n=1 Tax=Mucilaginibacter sp. PPCGB 2223 TaxID=1886027 RepID=UPI000826A53D|nr:hypothetical protein [Mucilaginibacter sp. PPCGB 2223]OCX52521.1 hypothetical protein BEL04_13765 [Mucilaginibacter sp. PPCGB 2223]
MQRTRAEQRPIASSRAIASQTTGKNSNSMPAVPVLQNKPAPAQKSAALIQGRFASNAAATAPIQLKLKRWKPKEFETTPCAKKDKEEFAHVAANKVSDAVDQAHAEIEVNNLNDANPAFQALYLLRLKEYQAGNYSMHPSTAAGYIIESKINNRLAGEDGFNFQTTGMLNGTRPDIAVDLGDDQSALIDITAEKSLGHIFMKKGNWTNHGHIPYVAEAWYQSISFTGKAEKLSKEQEELAIKAAENKRELAEVMSKEKAKYKTEQFLATQDNVFGSLADAGTKVQQYLAKRPRDMAALKAVGVDIAGDGKYISKTSIEARNEFVEAPVTTVDNPVPKFTEHSKERAINVINYAKRAVPKVRHMTVKPEKKFVGKWTKKFGKKKND